MVELSLDEVKRYAEALKVLIQAFTGRKPIGQKVAILANPENPKSMSILTRGQAKYVSLAYYLSGHEEWGGLWDCLRERAVEMMATSPSIEGMGREQVIAFVGALGGEKLLKELGFKTEIKAGKEES